MQKPAFFLSFGFLIWSASALAQPPGSPVLVTDLLKIKSIAGLTLNKDGSKLAFTVTAIERSGESKADYQYKSQLFLVPSDGSAAPRQLTFSESSSQPAWSPDSKQLAFVRTEEGKPQIFVLSFEGGEPSQFTHFKYGASNPKWSPDGKKILFSATIGLRELLKDSILNPSHGFPTWPVEDPGFDNSQAFPSSSATPDPDGSPEQAKAWLDKDIMDSKAKVVDRLNFQDEMAVNADLSFTHFFIQALQPGSTPQEVTHGFFRYSSVDFSPDGKRLLITASIDSSQHPDRVLESQIYLADSSGRNYRLLVAEKGKSCSSASISPGGNWIAFQTQPVSFANAPTLELLSLRGEPKSMLPLEFDRGKTNLVWTQDEKWIYFIAASNGGFPLFRISIPSGKTERLSGYDDGIGGFDLRGTHLVFAKTEIADPFELYTADTSLQNAKRISAFNKIWLSGKGLSVPEKHEFSNEQGMAIEYWLMKPVGFRPGKKYPLLLEIHGGPAGMWGPGEASMWHEFQYFCGKGYGVLYCNPRGSGGYGLDFLRANIKDWGTGPARDVLTSLDKGVSEGWVDEQNLFVSGGSYGGYLVAWIIAHDQRFNAACSQRGVYDLSTFFGEGNAWRLVPDYFGGFPWEPETRAILQRESPISYVDQIRTPYIIFHGENDRRTGFVQGEMLYRSLKVMGRPVEYVRHPGATHEITRSGDNRQRIDQLLRTYEFFERWRK